MSEEKSLKDDVALLKKVPTHVAVLMQGSSAWASKNNVALADAYKRRFDIVIQLLRTQVETGIPVVTFYLLPLVTPDSEHIMEKIDSLADFLDMLQSSEFLHKHSVKVSVWGKWYDLPGRIVESIKKIIDQTKEYDAAFVNFCINYDGQEEIVDASRLIARKVIAGKIDPEGISKDIIKEDIYTAYFMPPNLVIRTGTKPTLRGFLLWDSAYSTIYFPNKLWPDFTKEDFIKAIEYYNRFESASIDDL